MPAIKAKAKIRSEKNIISIVTIYRLLFGRETMTLTIYSSGESTMHFNTSTNAVLSAIRVATQENGVENDDGGNHSSQDVDANDDLTELFAVKQEGALNEGGLFIYSSNLRCHQ